MSAIDEKQKRLEASALSMALAAMLDPIVAPMIQSAQARRDRRERCKDERMAAAEAKRARKATAGA